MMWIPKTIAKSTDTDRPTTAVVSYSGTNVVSVDGDGNIEPVSPYGVAYIPPKGEKAFVMQVGSGKFLFGVSTRSPLTLEEGEIGLYSSGGASIILKNDGRVLINGKSVGE